MNDTTPEITKKMCELFRKKTPTERLEMGWSMYETSKFLVIEAIRKKNPHISENALKQELFLKFYGDCLEEEVKKQILQHFSQLK